LETVVSLFEGVFYWGINSGNDNFINSVLLSVDFSDKLILLIK